jgi:hypothetical protein
MQSLEIVEAGVPAEEFPPQDRRSLLALMRALPGLAQRLMNGAVNPITEGINQSAGPLAARGLVLAGGIIFRLRLELADEFRD